MATKKEGLYMFGPIKPVHGRRYKGLFESLKKFIKFRSKNQISKEEKLYALSNYGFIVYDKVYRKNICDVDYEQVKGFAAKNRFIIRHLLKDYFKVDLLKFEQWMHGDIDLIEIQMHRPGTNPSNKHIFG